VTLAEAWEMLANGDAAGAQAAFECLSDRAPGDGLSLVGLATASAIRKDDMQAVGAMRQALQQDPESLTLAPTDERLNILLADATARFQERARKQYGDVDALVMTGALCYLRRDMAEAHYAVEVALALDPADASARSLQGLIEQE
jgi:Flp pilus assembly protein TadD